MNVALTRDSINMGDDVDAPHYADVDVPDDATWGQLLEAVNATRYHHISAGRQLAWEVEVGVTSPKPIGAVVRYDELCYVIAPETPVTELFEDGRTWLNFSRVNGEPSAVRDKLLAGQSD